MSNTNLSKLSNNELNKKLANLTRNTDNNKPNNTTPPSNSISSFENNKKNNSNVASNSNNLGKNNNNNTKSLNNNMKNMNINNENNNNNNNNNNNKGSNKDSNKSNSKTNTGNESNKRSENNKGSENNLKNKNIANESIEIVKKNNTSSENKKENQPTRVNNTSKPTEDGESKIFLVVKIVIMVLVLVAIFYIARYLLIRYQTASVNSPTLLDGSKNAKHALVISQDPTSVNYIPITKSDGQDGIHFSYGFWILVEGFDYKKGEWKHIFHKGNSSSYPNRAPGAWLHPDKNSIRIYMNTLDNILEYVDVDNIPIRKWIYVNIVLQNRNLDIYVNAFLKVRKELSSLPKQNDDDLWINMYGGFEGYISNMKYYSYAIDFNKMNTTMKAGPSKNNCIDTGEVPPYLDDSWWFTDQ